MLAAFLAAAGWPVVAQEVYDPPQAEVAEGGSDRCGAVSGGRPLQSLQTAGSDGSAVWHSAKQHHPGGEHRQQPDRLHHQPGGGHPPEPERADGGVPYEAPVQRPGGQHRHL